MIGFVKVLSVLATIAVAFGFRHQALKSCRQRVTVLSMSKPSGFNIKVATAIATFASTVAFSSQPVLAAQYGGFGGSYAEVINPKDAVVNDETYQSDDVKAGISGLNTIISSVKAIRADLAKDNQIDVSSRLSSELNPGSIRSTLNKYNAAFSEDTQRGTDRLIRQVIQGVTELQRESQVKAGKSRSEAKMAALDKRLTAIEDALTSLSAFYPK